MLTYSFVSTYADGLEGARATSPASRRGRPARGIPCVLPLRLRDLLGAVSDDDPVTGRRMLTGSAYADDRHIRSRISIRVCRDGG
jgi:hypothetical protein